MHTDMSSYFEDPEFKKSLTKYEGMVESHTPTYFDAEELTDIAEYYASKNESEKSEAAIDYALHLHPSNTDALIFKSRTLYLKGDLKGSYEILGLIEDTSDREVKFLHAEILMEDKRVEEADAIHRELAKLENYSLEVMSDITLTYIDAHQKEYAEKWFQILQEQGYNETNCQIYRDLWCDFCNNFNEHGKAINAYQLTLDEHPYSINHWNNLAKCYLAMKDTVSAHDAIDFSLAIDENNEEAMFTKGLCFLYGKNQEEAIPCFRKVLPVAPEPKFVYGALLRCYNELQNAQESKNICIEWLKNVPGMTPFEKSEVYGFLSVSCFNLKEYEEGMKFIEASLDLNPFYLGALLQKGILHLKMIQEEEAEETFQLALDRAPEDEKTDMMYGIASSYANAGMYPGAIRMCERIIRMYPDDAKEAKYMIACFYFCMYDMDSCIKMLDRIFKENNNTFDLEFVEDERFKEMFNYLSNNTKTNR